MSKHAEGEITAAFALAKERTTKAKACLACSSRLSVCICSRACCVSKAANILHDMVQLFQLTAYRIALRSLGWQPAPDVNLDISTSTVKQAFALCELLRQIPASRPAN